MTQSKSFQIAMGILDIFFGIAFIAFSYLMLGKPLCGGGTITVWWALPFGIGGVIFLIIAIVWFNKARKI